MERKLFTLLTLVLLLFLCQASMLAHHGTSAYSTQVITMKGTVASFEFINPHSEIRVDVVDASGHTVSWLCEAGSLNFLIRRGWSRNSLKPGDAVTIMGNPGKSGTPNLRLTKVVLPDGKELDPLTGDQNVR
jgi:hypothetical protein